MSATLFLSPSNIQLLSIPFPYFPSTTKPLILKTPKIVNAVSSNATSFFLQNHSFSSGNTKNHNNNTENYQNSKNADEVTSSSSDKIKMPTAPWMKTPLFLPSDEVLDLSKPDESKKKTSNFEPHKADKSLTEKVSGRRGKKVMTKIVRRIEKLQLDSDLADAHKTWDDTQKNWDDFGSGFLLENNGESKFVRKLPWEKERKLVFRRMKKEKVVTAAELSLDKELLKRLRKEASKMRKWVKVKKAGVTQAIVNEVHKIWANNELVMLNFDLPLCRNMDRAREIVEIKTGGLVVWSRKDNLVAYRGCDYRSRRWPRKPYVQPSGERQTSDFTTDKQKLDVNFTSPKQSSHTENSGKEKDSLSPELLMDHNIGIKPTDRSLYEREGDRLLDGLGPRFIDWWYPKPLPVDGDLLPEVVPGFKPPFRLCLPRVRPQLTDDELTYLRKLARPLPIHFVLGRNSKLQGLAVAILKLWEKCHFAKIAVKWGRLTGGVLLLRNKFFIVLYRGKDFLPGNVANAVVEREIELQQWQVHEEDARLKAAGNLDFNDEKTLSDKSIIGTFSEFQHIQAVCTNAQQINNKAEIKLEAEKQKLEKELRVQERKLALLKLKIKKAEKELWKVNSAWHTSEEEPDQELITDEERQCFRNIGLKMKKGGEGSLMELSKAYISTGSIENLTLERESGGLLICIEKHKKGHAIIIYRGKNYKRPINFGENLLDKKKALKRSLELQRLGSLKFFSHQRDKEIAELKDKLADLEKMRNKSS
ncbi:Chloroplastic group IIA intron splicing facilitator CRS1 chloroplastic [Bienertia sinuspersici]